MQIGLLDNLKAKLVSSAHIEVYCDVDDDQYVSSLCREARSSSVLLQARKGSPLAAVPKHPGRTDGDLNNDASTCAPPSSGSVHLSRMQPRLLV